MAMMGTAWVDGSWAALSWVDGSWVDTPPAVDLAELTTALTAHVEDTLYPATPSDDYVTLVTRDVPVMRADAGSLGEDVNTDYAQYLN